MVLLNNILGFSAFGIGVRAFQLGIQKRSLTSNPLAYGLSALGFGAFGYMVDGWEKRQVELIAEKEELLKERRKQAATS
ncbi:hypothetical protein FRB99_006064 [Tulasnella sp. 403]|nr:hypothetical protein FRB99_006064 [Tulasnella sp. 403]